MCSSSDPGRFPCVCFASLRSVTTAFSGKSGATVWQRSDRHRKRLDRTSCETSACYSAKVSAVSARARRRFACATGAFSPLLGRIPSVVPALRAAHLRLKRRGRESNPRIAVLQTATLPLGYPAVSARADNIVVAALVSSADPGHICFRRGERLYNSAASTL